ncbi:MAG: hypothetical protein M1835_002294 [Candelina submexicana]|nr:MAG: hypothetical protein M1835_002294 [Candelina submexicana]
MLFDDEDIPPLKKWIVQRLEDISDADSDVLADYVIALVRTEAPDDEVKTSSIENLEDFLRENTSTFVEDIFTVIHTKSYLPGHAIAQPPPDLSPTFLVPSGPSSAPYGRAFNGAHRGRNDQSRKRSYNDRDGHDFQNGQDPHYGRNAGEDRAIKQIRRGGYRGGKLENGGGRPGLPGLQNGGNTGLPGLQQSAAPFPSMPPPLPGFPHLDPNDPMSAIMAMQAMGFPPLPGMPPFPQAGSPTGFGAGISSASFAQLGGQRAPGADVPQSQKISERCRDYDQKGFCALGGTCRYEHGSDHIVVPGQNDEYDPTNSSIMMDMQKTSPAAVGGHSVSENNRGTDRGRGRGRGRGDRGGYGSSRGGRASFSHAGPISDRSVTTIVVEQIPEEKFDEGSVRHFFSEFGNILEVTMQAYKRLALVKFDEWVAAKRAYDSPKVIFDNRFVKVYWYKPETLPTAPMNGAAEAGSPMTQISKSDEPAFDKEEFELKQAAAQKAHEEKMQKLKETETAREALEKRKEELMRSQQEEKKKLLERLAARTGSSTTSASSTSPSATSPPEQNGVKGGEKKETKQTEALKRQLAALEAEAKSLGLDTALSDDTWAPRGRGRGRGTYRGRGGFVPRGSGFDSSRGGYRGRGTPFGRGGGGTFKLDNRTRRVAVSGTEFDASKDEALRQYLLGIGEFENIEPNPDRADSQIIYFADRFTAEKFFYSSSEIPSIGKVELSWINTPIQTSSSSTLTSKTQDIQPNDGDETMQDNDAENTRNEVEDYDVADDDGVWGVE